MGGRTDGSDGAEEEEEECLGSQTVIMCVASGPRTRGGGHG